MVALTDDRATCARLAAGDQSALSQLYGQYRRAVYARAYLEVESRPDAEEVLQDAFVLLWKKRRKINLVGGSVLPWLLASARYLGSNKRRHSARRSALPLEERPVGSLDPEQIVARRDLDELVREAVARLDPIDRAIVQLCLVDGLSYKEAAVRLRTTHAAVRNRLSRARFAVRADLSARMNEEA